MSLALRKILILIADGVEEEELQQITRSLEREGAEIFLTTTLPQLLVETVTNEHRGKEVLIDIPYEIIDVGLYDVLLVPPGKECREYLRNSAEASVLIQEFNEQGKVTLACWNELKGEESILPIQYFVPQAGEIGEYIKLLLIDDTSTLQSNTFSSRLNGKLQRI